LIDHLASIIPYFTNTLISLDGERHWG
jgi:hypothetical protein